MAKKHKLEDALEPSQPKRSKLTTMSSQQTVEQLEQSPKETQKVPQANDQTNLAPAIPDSVPEPSEILPANLAHLVQKYSFARMSIKPNSKINSKVKSLLSHMSRFSFADKNPKPGIIVIDARASDATKMLSVIEITKREIETEERAGKWFQYSRVSGELTRIARRSKNTSSQGKDEVSAQDEAGSKAEDEATASKTQANEDIDTKLRAVPILTIYMARVSISELRQEYGEQTNASSSGK